MYTDDSHILMALMWLTVGNVVYFSVNHIETEAAGVTPTVYLAFHTGTWQDRMLRYFLGWR